MKYPVVSVIVPVYNAEKYLDKCIRSILCQAFTDFELLLIDDGSTDHSGSICDEYAGKDNRIKVFHKANGGVSSARNVGLDNSKGEWITFVDSDDWVEQDYLSNLISQAHANVDLIIADYNEIEEKKSEYILVTDYNRLISENVQCYTVPWGKLYRASIIKSWKIRFLEKMRLGEDAVFLWTYMLHSKCVCCIGSSGYHYNTETTSSLSKRVFPIENELFAYEQVNRNIDKFISRKNIVEFGALERLTMLKVFFVRRVLDALYHNYVKRNDRLNIIGKVDVELYSLKLHSSSCREKIFVWLLKKKFYLIYDFLRSSVVSIKRLNKLLSV